MFPEIELRNTTETKFYALAVFSNSKLYAFSIIKL